jgi:hypothetical protein
MVRDDLLMTGDTSFAAKYFDALIDNALGVAGTPVSYFHLYSAFARLSVSVIEGCIAPASALCPPRRIVKLTQCLCRQWPLDPTNGLINTSNVLIDWPSGMRDRYELTAHNSVANAFGVYGLDTLVEIAGYLGRTADVAKYKARADTLRASIDTHLWSAKGGAGWTSGGAYTDGPPCKNVSAEAGKPGKVFPCSSHAAFHSSVCASAHAACSCIYLSTFSCAAASLCI